MNPPWPQIIISVIAGIFAALVVRRVWPKEGKWGINQRPVTCSQCGTPTPRFRKPANRRQMLWGGWTCQKCGVEIDKYGKLLADTSETHES